MLLRKWIALVLQVTFRFMGCLVQANTLVSGIDSIVVIMTVNSIIAFTKQSSAERYLAFFRQYFYEFSENSRSGSKEISENF